jgi:signal transduction histidine kinase/ligand-binding sensor domain-containing protein
MPDPSFIIVFRASLSTLTCRVKAVLCTLWMFLVASQGSSQITTQYFHTETFSLEQGLNHTVILDFQPDHNGFLWIHTVGSLQLFDGKNFVNMNPVLGEEPLTGNFNNTNSDEIYFLSKNKLYRLNEDQYEGKPAPHTELPQLPDIQSTYTFLYENGQDLFIWDRADSLYQIDKKKLRLISKFLLPIRPNKQIGFAEIMPAASHQDSIEFVATDSVLYYFDLKTGKMIPRVKFERIESMTKLAKDTIIALGVENMYMYSSTGIKKLPLPENGQLFLSDLLLQADQHSLLIVLRNSIYRFDTQLMRFVSKYHTAGGDAVLDFKLRMMKKDSQGNLYISTFNKGLLKLHSRNTGFSYIGTSAAKKTFVKCLNGSDSNNLILMGTIDDGLLLFDTSGTLLKQITEFPGGKKEKYIWAILKISDTQFIIFTDYAYILNTADRTFTLTKIDAFDASWISYYNQTIENPIDQKYYLSVYKGLLRFTKPKELQMEYEPSHVLNGSHAIAAFESGYISSFKDQLVQFDPDFNRITASWKLPSFGFSRCIIQYAENKVLLGTDLGLYLISMAKEELKIDRIYDKMVYAILPGQQAKEFWFSTDYGLYRLNAAMQLSHYSKESGLQENEFNTNSCYKSLSGKLYFGGINGITAFYPSAVNESKDHVLTYISKLTVNNEVVTRYIMQESVSDFTFSHNDNNIGIELLAKGSKSPASYNYQYWMKGLTSGWIDMGKENNLNFHLAPGDYTFYYHIGDGFDPKAATENQLTFTIRPPVYRRWWFLTTSILMLLGIGLYLSYQQRKRKMLQLEYERQLKQQLHGERMRISRELHDNIGAQMATVKRNINFLTSRNHQLPPEAVMDKMKALEHISTQINQELRDTIWAVQNEHISVFDFIARLKNYVFQVLGPESDIRVHYEEQCDKQVILGPFVALNLHRICQETINNVIKHAGASEIKIVLEGDQNMIKVTIIDNGKGYDVDQTHAGNGIHNIRYRARQIGAELYFNRIERSGSSLEVIVTQSQLTNKKQV